MAWIANTVYQMYTYLKIPGWRGALQGLRVLFNLCNIAICHHSKQFEKAMNIPAFIILLFIILSYLVSVLQSFSRQLISEVFITQYISEKKCHQETRKKEDKFE